MKKTITFQQVLKVIGELDCRPAIMARFKARGGDVNRWQLRDLDAMAEALTRTEDELESRHGSKAAAAKAAIGPLRRAIEDLPSFGSSDARDTENSRPGFSVGEPGRVFR